VHGAAGDKERDCVRGVVLSDSGLFWVEVDSTMDWNEGWSCTDMLCLSLVCPHPSKSITSPKEKNPASLQHSNVIVYDLTANCFYSYVSAILSM
jgi:hypothetical protein